jgi:hypothetical protein
MIADNDIGARGIELFQTGHRNVYTGCPHNTPRPGPKGMAVSKVGVFFKYADRYCNKGADGCGKNDDKKKPKRSDHDNTVFIWMNGSIVVGRYKTTLLWRSMEKT